MENSTQIRDERPIILLAVGSCTNRELLRKITEAHYQIQEAQNGTDAILKMRSERVSLLLADLQGCRISDADDFELLKIIQNDPALCCIPVVFIEQNKQENNENSTLTALEYGVAALLSPPIEGERLLRQLENILTGAKLCALKKENERMREQLRQKEELIRCAKFDEITGLYNKKSFCEKVRYILDNEPDEEFFICRFDIDSFKLYNDVSSFEGGNKILKYLADRMNEAQDMIRLATHIYADRFELLLEGRSFCEQGLISRISGWLEAADPGYTFSFRLGFYRIENKDAEVGLMGDKALLALNSVKRSTTDITAYYDESLRRRLLEEQSLLSEINTAFEKGQFEVWFQPQYNFETGLISGAEALVRWAHPKKGMISPGLFIPVMEKNSLITKLDNYIIEKSCAYLQKWMKMEGQGELYAPSVSVNVSRLDIYRNDLADKFSVLTGKYGIPNGMLHIEITESAYIQTPEKLISAVKRLREKGFVVEMDDFGSGYSSLNTLKDVPVNILKLDMGFLSGTMASERGGNILSSVVRMAHWLNLPVICEGVETEEQAIYLRSIGCDLMQGYLFAHPMPASDFELLLRKNAEKLRAYKNGQSQSALGSAERQKRAKNAPVEQFWDASNQAALIFDSFVGGAIIVELRDDNVELLRANNKFYAMLKKTVEAYRDKTRNILEVFEKKYADMFMKMLIEAHDTDDEASCELHCPTVVNSHRLWVGCRAKFLAEKANAWIFYVNVEDISERKRLEIDNRRISMRLQSLVERLSCGILNYDTNGRVFRVTYYNDVLPQLCGYSAEEFHELFGDDILSVVHKKETTAFCEFMKKASLAEEGILQRRFWLRRKDKKYIPVECSIKAITDPEDKLTHATMTIQDRSTSEEEQRVQERYRFVVERSGDIVFEINYKTGEFIATENVDHFALPQYYKFDKRQVEKFHEDMIRASRRMIIPGQELEDDGGLIHPADRRQALCFFNAMREGTNNVKGIIRLRAKDGNYIFTDIAAGRFGRKNSGRYIGTLKDIDFEIKSKLNKPKL